MIENSPAPVFGALWGTLNQQTLDDRWVLLKTSRSWRDSVLFFYLIQHASRSLVSFSSALLRRSQEANHFFIIIPFFLFPN